MYFKPTPNDLLEGNDKMWAMRKLLYPGDNYVRDFSGTTNPNGQFVYIGQLEKMVMLENSQSRRK